jgi:glycosyltransferase involved in cell wall biosynthesis
MTSLNTTLVSVILPVYGDCEYLKESINSILIQSIQNFEIILIIDNIIVDENFIIKNNLKDSRIKIIKGSSNGLSSALNTGLKFCSGKYIARMDSDDISHQNRFEKQIEFLEKNDLDACGSFIKYFGSVNYTKLYPVEFENIIYLSQFGTQLAHPSVLFKSSFFSSINYNENLKYAEDYMLWFNAFKLGKKISNIPEILLSYRTHINQASKASIDLQMQISYQISRDISIFFYNDKYLKLFDDSLFGFKSNFRDDEAVRYLESFLYESSLQGIDLQILKNYFLSICMKCNYIRIKNLLRLIKISRNFELNISLFHFHFLHIQSVLPVRARKSIISYAKRIY